MLVTTRVVNTGSTSTPQRLNAKVAIPDSITSAQKATTQKAKNDCGLNIAGFAWRPTGTSKSNKIARRSFIKFTADFVGLTLSTNNFLTDQLNTTNESVLSANGVRLKHNARPESWKMI